jgi:hypothetical protein
MLQDIIDSKTDSSILSFFLSAPQRSFSLNEVSRRLNIPNLKAARSLGQLALAGPLRSFSKKGKKYFIINPKYKLLPEMKGYWAKSGPKYNDELFSAIRKLGKIKAAFLSGLFCGQQNLPVDLLLVGKVNLKKLSDFLKATEKLMGQEINYSIMTVEEFLIRRDTFDKFIKDIFDYPHLAVVDELSKKQHKAKKEGVVL